jgi:protein CpxP
MRLLLVVATAVMLSNAAIAQTDAGPGSGASNPDSTGTVVPGANSFTEGQARSRIESRGFSSVSELEKDDQGIWHGKAQREGRSVEVMLDYRGNIAWK